MGRPKFFNERKLICFNLEKEEREKVAEIAKEMGMEISSYLRWLLKRELRKIEKEERREI